MTLTRLLSVSAAALALAAAAPALAQTAAPAPAQAQAGAPTVERSVKVEPGGLYEIVFNPADNAVYVAAVGPRGADNASIARLDGRTLQAGQPIDVSEHPLYGLGLNSRTQTLYGSDTRQGVVSAVDLRSGQIVANLKPEGSTNAHLRQVVVDEAANRVYASVFGGRGGAADQVWVINGADNTFDRAITADVAGLTGLALDAANNRLFVTGLTNNEVAVIDLATDRVTARWPSGGEGAINVAYDAAGDRLFVANQGTGALTVLNAATGELLRTVPTGAGALAVNHDPVLGRIYVSNRQAGTVSVIDSRTYAVIANLETGTFPQTIAVDRATHTVYVTNKARGLPRGAEPGTPVPADPNGDTVTVIRP